MQSYRFVLLALTLAPCSAALGAEDSPRAIVERAIQAQGGEAQLAKLRVMRVKAEGRTELVPGRRAVPFVLEDVWQLPDAYKSTLTLMMDGHMMVHTQAIDGDRGWASSNGQVQDFSGSALEQFKVQRYAERLDHLLFLNDKDVELLPINEIKVSGKPAVGVMVRMDGRRDVKLYFDKASGLLVKREHRIPDGSGKEVLQEVFFSDYADKDGLKHYRRISAHRNGRRVIDARITEIEFFDKLDPKAFARP